MNSSREKARLFLQTISLPAIPAVALSLVKSIDADSDIGEIAEIILRDPGIAAATLKQANSARYGLATKVASVQDAIRIIGIKNVRQIAVAIGLLNNFPRSTALDWADFSRYASQAGVYAASIARMLKSDDEVPWLVAFMSRLGELLFGQLEAKMIAEIEVSPREPGYRQSREMGLVGVSESTLVGELADVWNFPDVICRALVEMEAPMSDAWPFNEAAAISHLGVFLADCAQERLNVEDVLLKLPRDVMNALDVPVAELLDLYVQKANLTSTVYA